MPIPTLCPNCAASLTVEEQYAHDQIVCPECRHQFAVSAPVEDAVVSNDTGVSETAPVRSVMMGGEGYCPNCAIGLVAGARMCVSCGFNLISGKMTGKRRRRYVFTADFIVKITCIGLAIMAVGWAYSEGWHNDLISYARGVDANDKNKNDRKKKEQKKKKPRIIPDQIEPGDTASAPPIDSTRPEKTVKPVVDKIDVKPVVNKTDPKPAVNKTDPKPAVDTTGTRPVVTPIVILPTAPNGWETKAGVFYSVAFPRDEWTSHSNNRYSSESSDSKIILACLRFPGMPARQAYLNIASDIRRAVRENVDSTEITVKTINGRNFSCGIHAFPRRGKRYAQYVFIREQGGVSFAFIFKTYQADWARRQDALETIIGYAYPKTEWGKTFDESAPEEVPATADTTPVKDVPEVQAAKPTKKEDRPQEKPADTKPKDDGNDKLEFDPGAL